MDKADGSSGIKGNDAPMRIGFIGCGKRAVSHMASLASLGTCVSVQMLCDIDPTAIEKAGQFAPEAASGSDPVALLEKHPCDLVVVSLSPAAGRKTVRDALVSASELKAVLVEKPAALNAELAEATFSGVRVPVYVCHQLRFLPWAGAFRDWFREQTVDISWKIDTHCFGKLYDQGLHMIDMAYWLMGRLPDKIARSVCEDDPARLSNFSPIPYEWRADCTHPGPLWFDVEGEWADSCRFELRAGPPAAMSWMGKFIRIERGESWLRFGTSGIETGGDFSCKGLDWKRKPGDYEQATTAVYEAFYQWTRNSGPQPDLPTIEEHIDQMIWCDNIIRSPLTKRLTRPWYLDSPVYPDGVRKLTIIIPLSDHRGMAEKCIRSWTLHQECNPEDFQLVIISNRQTEDMASSLKPLLRDHDLWIATDQPPAPLGQGDMEEYQIGIDATRAEWIFLSEPHCEATPECVRELRDYFATSEVAGFCTTTIDGYANPWGKMEAMYFLHGFEEWRKAGHWAKMIMRGFGIRRRVYEQVGGFRLRYGRFSEWLLAADLHRGGWYLGYAPGVELVHHYTVHKAFLDEAIEEFVIGHAHYLAEVPREERLPYFPDVSMEMSINSDWEKVKKNTNSLISLSNRIRGAMKRLLNGRYRNWLSREWNGFSVALFAGFWPERAFPFFIGYYEAQISLCMGKHLPRFTQEKKPNILRSGDEWTAGQGEFLAELPGFYGHEEWKEEAFHWCRPVGGIYLETGGHAMALEIDLLDVIGKIRPDQITLASGRKRGWKITPKVEEGETRLRFEIPAESAETAFWVALVSRSRPTSKAETRELGLPVRSIRLIKA